MRPFDFYIRTVKNGKRTMKDSAGTRHGFEVRHPDDHPWAFVDRISAFTEDAAREAFADVFPGIPAASLMVKPIVG